MELKTSNHISFLLLLDSVMITVTINWKYFCSPYNPEASGELHPEFGKFL